MNTVMRMPVVGHTPCADPSVKTMTMPCDVAVRVIATSIEKSGGHEGSGTARLTLSLTPVPRAAGADSTGALDLADWPNALECAWPSATEKTLYVMSLGKDGGRKVFSGKQTPDCHKVGVTRNQPVDPARISLLWTKAMGSDAEFAVLADAYKGNLGKTTLDDLRRTSKGNGTDATPEIHGTDRSISAVDLSLERAYHLLLSLTGKVAETRVPPFDADESDVEGQLADLYANLLSATPADPSATPVLRRNLDAIDGVLQLPTGATAADRYKLVIKLVAGIADPDAAKKQLNDKLGLEGIARARCAENHALAALQDSQERAEFINRARNAYLGAADSSAALKVLESEALRHAIVPPSAVASNYFAVNPQQPAPAKPVLPTTTSPNTDGARAAYRLGSSTLPPPAAATTPAEQQTEAEVEAQALAQRRLYAIFSYPSLARLFGFVIDIEVSVDRLLDHLGATPDFLDDVADLDVSYTDAGTDIDIPPAPKGPAEVWYLALALSVQSKTPDHIANLWCAAKLRNHKKGNGHFLPCTREEIDARAAGDTLDVLRGLAVAEQLDGIVDLGQTATNGTSIEPRFDILTLDATASTVADEHLDTTRLQAAMVLKKASDYNELLPPGILDAPDRRRATLRTGGFALTDRWRQNHVIDRYCAADAQYAAKGPVLLDASDLTIGYRLDVGVKSRNDATDARRRWHTLMHRRLKFSSVGPEQAGKPLDTVISAFYPSAFARELADEGLLSVPTAYSRNAVATPPAKCMAFAEETVGTWRGDPLGLATGLDPHYLESDDLRINVEGSLRTNQEGGDYTPPPLRFGWRYHFGLRAVFPGGGALPLSRALCHYERSYNKGLALPSTAEAGRSHRRHERIEAPQALLPLAAVGVLENGSDEVRLLGRYPAPQAAAMIVRTLEETENQTIAGVNVDDKTSEGLAISRRIILAPSIALDFATAHGVFVGKDCRFEAVPNILEPRLLHDERDNDPNTLNSMLLPKEGYTCEWTTRPSDPLDAGPGFEKWRNAFVAWKRASITSRPCGGLAGVDHHAVWGGFPIFQSKAVQQPAPKFDEKVQRRDGSVTDLGRILSRRDGVSGLIDKAPDGITDKNWAAALTWNAAAGPPQGSAVFRILQPTRATKKERIPYYPDPAAERLIVEVEITGKQPTRVAVSLYKGPTTGPVPGAYPDARPLSLELQRVKTRGGAKVIEAQADRTFDATGQAVATTVTSKLVKALGPTNQAPSIAMTGVVIRLEPGEAATVRIWCVPSFVFLYRMFEGTEALAALAIAAKFTDGNAAAANGLEQDAACKKSLGELAGLVLPKPKKKATSKTPHGSGLGGLPIGTDSNLQSIARLLLDHIEKAPLPEIAAVLELTAVHAIDLPLEPPSRPDVKPPDVKKKPGVPPAPPPLPLVRTDPDRLVALLGDTLIAGPDENLRTSRDKWNELESQKPGATGILLGGSLKVHGPSTGAIEVRASGAATARGRFDDADRGRSRDQRARGLWPKPNEVDDIEPQRLYGFKIGTDGLVTLQSESVALLRVDSFGPDVNKIDLFTAQVLAERARTVLAAGDTPDTQAPRCQRLSPIADGRARWLEISAVAVSRHGALLATRYGEQAERLVRPEGATPAIAFQWLPATIRPARIAALSLIPSFAWDSGQKPEARNLLRVSLTRQCYVRVRMKRPWFSSGEDERVGIVMWPPNLFENDAIRREQPDSVQPLAPEPRARIDLANLPSDGGDDTWQQLQDTDLGPGGAWVSRWGSDPIKVDNEIKGWLLTSDHFDGLSGASEENWAAAPGPSAPGDAIRVGKALMPLPVSEDASPRQDAKPAGGFMSVALATYRARFDPVDECWFADVAVQPQNALEPFVRLGLVRYQPHAPAPLRLSEPISEWTKLLPDRKMEATRKPETGSPFAIEVTLSGSAYETMQGVAVSSLPPSVRMTLLRDNGDGVQHIVGDHENKATVKVVSAARLEWQFSFRSDDPAFAVLASDFEEASVRWSVHMEEVDHMRPATYPDEPRYNTKDDDVFASTGPRFMGLLPLDGLKKKSN